VRPERGVLTGQRELHHRARLHPDAGRSAPRPGRARTPCELVRGRRRLPVTGQRQRRPRRLFRPRTGPCPSTSSPDTGRTSTTARPPSSSPRSRPATTSSRSRSRTPPRPPAPSPSPSTPGSRPRSADTPTPSSRPTSRPCTHGARRSSSRSAVRTARSASPTRGRPPTSPTRSTR
jgi:hypothetical protein